jgi:hypothetical protein
MGQQKTEQTTTIPAAGAAESNLLRLLQQLAQSGAGQLGDLSALAQGQFGMPTEQDIQLIAQSIGRARQLAESQLQASGDVLGARAREDLAARGVSGSSSEVVSNLLNQLGTQQSIAQSILGAQQAGGEALMALPFQRAGVQLSANQQLFNQILGAAQPAIMAPLQARLAQGTTTQTQSGFGLGQLAGLTGLGQFAGGALSQIPGLGFLSFLNQQNKKTGSPEK